jgi:hypothetical protein
VNACAVGSFCCTVAVSSKEVGVIMNVRRRIAGEENDEDGSVLSLMVVAVSY